MYLIEREQNNIRPNIIIVNSIKMAKYLAGSTNDKANIFELSRDLSMGILQVRWKGLDIDYGSIVSSIKLPNGEEIGFYHNRNERPWTLIKEAYWYDDKKVPNKLLSSGVRLLTHQSHIDNLINDLRATKYYSLNDCKDFKLDWMNYNIDDLIKEFESKPTKIFNYDNHIYTTKISNDIDEVKDLLEYNSNIHKYKKMKVFYNLFNRNFEIPLKDIGNKNEYLFIGNIIVLSLK